MPQQTKTFRIFVSSTFSDLKAERNALQEKVFPKIVVTDGRIKKIELLKDLLALERILSS